MQNKQKNTAPLQIGEDEIRLFRESVKDISPLSHDKIVYEPPKPKHKHQPNQPISNNITVDILSDQSEMEEIKSTDILSYCPSGIQKKTFKKLRRGQYIIIDELDLHGLNVKQAKKLLLRFLEVALQIESSCVLIVHGKGHRSGNKEPVIKQQTNHWLKQHPRVLAYHSAQVKDGGTGAVYVLLRRTPLPA